MSVNHSARSGDIIGIYFCFLHLKIRSVFSLESPHRGESNEYTQNTTFNIKKKSILKNSKSAAMGLFPRDSITSSTTNRDKRVISNRASEVLLYFFQCELCSVQ